MNYIFTGIRIVYNLRKPEGEQIDSILIRCQNCTIPKYEPLDMEKYYKLAVPSYLSRNIEARFSRKKRKELLYTVVKKSLSETKMIKKLFIMF